MPATEPVSESLHHYHCVLYVYNHYCYTSAWDIFSVLGPHCFGSLNFLHSTSTIENTGFQSAEVPVLHCDWKGLKLTALNSCTKSHQVKLSQHLGKRAIVFVPINNTNNTNLHLQFLTTFSKTMLPQVDLLLGRFCGYLHAQKCNTDIFRTPDLQEDGTHITIVLMHLYLWCHFSRCHINLDSCQFLGGFQNNT